MEVHVTVAILEQQRTDRRENAPDLGLENDDAGQREIEQQTLHDAREDIEVEQVGKGDQRGKQHSAASKHLAETRSLGRPQHPVEHQVEDENLYDVVQERHVEGYAGVCHASTSCSVVGASTACGGHCSAAASAFTTASA